MNGPDELRQALRHMDRAVACLDLIAASQRIDNVMTARTLLGFVSLLVLQATERLEGTQAPADG